MGDRAEGAVPLTEQSGHAGCGGGFWRSVFDHRLQCVVHCTTHHVKVSLNTYTFMLHFSTYLSHYTHRHSTRCVFIFFFVFVNRTERRVKTQSLARHICPPFLQLCEHSARLHALMHKPLQSFYTPLFSNPPSSLPNTFHKHFLLLIFQTLFYY